MQFALTTYPLSKDYQRRLEAAVRTAPEYLDYAQLRTLSPLRLVQKLRGLRATRLLLPIEDELSRCILPLLKGVEWLDPHAPIYPEDLEAWEKFANVKIGSGDARGTPRRYPRMLKLSNVSVTFSPAKALRRNRSTSRVREDGFTKGIPFHPSTMACEDEPMPSSVRSGASVASVAAVCASKAGPRVKLAAIEVPSRMRGTHCEASTSGVKAS